MQKPVWPAGSGVLVVFVVFLVALFSLLLLLPGGGAFAGEETEDDRLTILITASRFAETVDETLAPVTVITRKEIEQKQAATVEEVLRAVPGVTLSNNGGTGKVTTLFLRGTNSNHVLVLIDGVKVGSAANGLTQFEHLPLDQIEKIEVVRGPRSSLYGSEAIGGVIQIFTRKGTKETRPRFSVSTGTHDTYKGEVGVSGGGENAWYSLGASTVSTDGYDACRAGFCITERDEDGYDNDSFSLRGSVALTDYLAIEGNFLNSDSESEFDGSSQNQSKTTNRTTSVKISLRANEIWESSLLLAEHRDESENFVDCDAQVNPVPSPFGRAFDPPCVTNVSADGTSFGILSGVRYASEFNTKRQHTSWQNNFRLNKNSRIVAGVDYQDDEIGSSENYAVDSRDNTGVFALLRTEINDDDFELSLRNDHNEQFGDHDTGNIVWGRDFGDGKRMTASYGTAFSAPTFNDLYFPGFGNPDLEPEESKSFDFGFLHTGNQSRWGVNLYHTEIEDLITYIGGTYENVEEAEISGVEFSAGTTAGEWDITGTLTWLDTEQTKGENKGKQLLKRPRKKLDLDFSRRFGKYLFGANIFAQGQSEDFGNVDLAGFALVNLRGEFRIERNWSLGLKINNLFDKEYETADGYPQDGLNFLATLRYIP